jgi:hypothetical protein
MMMIIIRIIMILIMIMIVISIVYGCNQSSCVWPVGGQGEGMCGAVGQC